MFFYSKYWINIVKKWIFYVIKKKNEMIQMLWKFHLNPAQQYIVKLKWLIVIDHLAHVI